MRDQTIIQQFGQMQQQINNMESQLVSMSKVLRDIVGKELMRSQAVQAAIMKKGVVTDAEIVAALQELIDDAKKDLKEEADKVEAEKMKAVEILVPNNFKTEEAVAPETTTEQRG